MKKAGSVTDLYKIRAAIAQVLPVGDHSTQGVFKITPQGQLLKPYYLMEILNNKFAKPIRVDPVAWCMKFGPVWPATWPTVPWKE